MLKAPWERGEYALLPGDGSKARWGLLLLAVTASAVLGGLLCLLLLVL